MYNKNKRLIINILLVTIIVSILSFFTSNLIIKASDGVYYYDELEINQFIPNNSIIVTNIDYHEGSNFYTTNAKIHFLSDEENPERCKTNYCGKTETIKEHTNYQVKDYNSIFGTTDKQYDGWKVYKYSYYHDVVLVPTNKEDSSDIEQEPAEDKYEVTTRCSDKTPAKTIWYKFTPVTDYEKLGNKWNIEENLYSIRAIEDQKNTWQNSLRFSYQGKQNDLLYYKMKYEMSYSYSNLDYDNYDIITIKNDDDEFLDFDYYSSSFSNFRKFFTEINDSNMHNLTFTVNKESLYSRLALNVKDIMILTEINEGNKLDTTTLNNNDNILYITECEDGYNAEGKVLFKKEEEIPSDKVITKNPFTGNTLLTVFAIITLIITIGLLMIINKQKTQE